MFTSSNAKRKCSSRDRLILAAQQLAQEQSFDDITIDDILKIAELSRPAFYYHFAGGKEELRSELVGRGLLSEAPAQDTRQVILEAALRVFARSGVSAATLDDIATEANVSRGALTWHFHSKEELLTGIIKYYGPHSMLRSITEQIEQDLHNGVPLDDEAIFRRIAGAFYDSFTTHSDYTRLAILLVYTHPEVANILVNKIAPCRKSAIKYIQLRQEEGRFCKNIDPRLFMQMIGLTFAMRVICPNSNEFLSIDHLTRDEVIDQLVSLLLYGIVQREQLPEHTV